MTSEDDKGARGDQTNIDPQQQTLRRLCWLARAMTEQAQTVFLIERLQPKWLATRAGRFQYVLLDRCIGGLLGGLVGGLLGGPVYRLGAALVCGLVTLFFGGKLVSKRCNNDRPDARSVMRSSAGSSVGSLVGSLVGWSLA
jgi:hypothetical protein